MAKIFQNRGGTLTQILNTDDYVNIGNVTQSIAGTKTFSGTVNVPNVAAGDSSTKAANTKFVHDELLKYLTCYEATLEVSTPISSGSSITIPSSLKYIVGSNMLEVSYNGLVEYRGSQYTENGTVGSESTSITIQHNLEAGDSLVFRINGLCDVDTVTDAVHTSGDEAVGGVKSFSSSPTVPNITNTSDSSTKVANTKFVHDLVDGYANCQDEVLDITQATTSGSNVTLPSGMQYVVGTNQLMVSYNGTVCHVGEQFNEVGSNGSTSTQIQILFDLRVGDKLGFRINGFGNVTDVPALVHKSGAETIEGVKTFTSIPSIPTTDPAADSDAASKKYVDTKVNLIYRTGETGDDVAAAHNCIYRGKDLTNVYTIAQLSEKVAAGDFSDLYIGDYITKPFAISYSGTLDGETITINVTSTNFNFRIAHFNYWKYMGDTSCNQNHIVFVPDKPFFSTKMRKTNTTAGGIPATNVWTLLQGAVYNSVTASTCMGSASHVITHRDYIPANVNTDYYSAAGQGWKGSTYYVSSPSDWRDVKLGLMHEGMVYGGDPMSSSGRDTGCGKSQLALFRLDPTWINCRSARAAFWLCAVTNSTSFASAGGYGDASVSTASGSRGVRPYFLFS